MATRFGKQTPDARLRWREGLQHELTFWRKFLTGPEFEWHRDVRFSPEYQFPDFGRELFASSGLTELKVLDVGSGPASTIGRKWPGHVIDLTPLDPLAKHFNTMLERTGYGQFANVVHGTAEMLPTLFEPGTFDWVYRGNALDHTHAPLTAIESMLAVAKPGGWVTFVCYENEAVTEGYTGLHQWNFCIRDERLVLWNSEDSVDVFKAVPGCETYKLAPMPPHANDARARLIASIRKA